MSLLSIVHKSYAQESTLSLLPFFGDFLIENPLARQLDEKACVELINTTLHLLGPYVAQYASTSFIGYKTGVSFTSDMNNDGAIYLLGTEPHETQLSAVLRNALPKHIAQEVKSFPIIQQSSKLYKRVIADPEDGVIAHHSVLVDRYVDAPGKSMQVLSPPVILHQMFDGKALAQSTTLKLSELAPLFAQLGFSFDNVPAKSPIFMERLYQHSNVLTPAEYDEIKSIVSIIYDKCYTPFNERLNQHLRKCVGVVGHALITSTYPHYDIFYRGNTIGALGQLRNKDWIVAQHTSGLPMDLNTVSHTFPSNIRALLPERRVRNGLPCSINEVDLPNLLNEKPFLMNNLSVVPPADTKFIKTLQEDVLSDKLSDVSGNILHGDVLDILNAHKENPTRQADKILGDIKTPSIAGAQAKVPVSLSCKDGVGTISLAQTGSFSHILKVHNNDDPKKHAMIYCEAFGMLAAKAIGLPVADVKMIRADVSDASEILPGEEPVLISKQSPSLVIERFDIRHKEDNPTVSQYNEELISLTRCPDKAYTGDGNEIHGIDIVAHTIKKHSTDWQADKEILFKTALLNTLIGNIDAHLKNWSMLHTMDENGVYSCRCSPAYDIVAVRCCDAYYFDSSGICQINNNYHVSKKDVFEFGTQLCELPLDKVDKLYQDVTNTLRQFVEQCDVDPDLRSVFTITPLGENVIERCKRFVNRTIASIETGAIHDIEVDFKHVFCTKRTMAEFNQESNAIIEQLEYRAAQDALDQLNENDERLRELFSDDSIMDLDGLFSVSSSPPL